MFPLRSICAVLILFFACSAPVKENNSPGSLQAPGPDQRYQLQEFLSPSSLAADFNGDGQVDRAYPITEKETGKKGILLIHGGTGDYFVFGAGTPFGENDDDYSWADEWNVYNDAIAYETQFDEESGDIIGGKEVQLQHPALRVMAVEDGSAIAGGIIYWDGKQYVWIHQGE